MARMNYFGESNGNFSDHKTKDSVLWPALIVIFIISVVIVICATTVSIEGTNEGNEIDPFIEFEKDTRKTKEDFPGNKSNKLRDRTRDDYRHLVVVPRRDWIASPPKSTTPLNLPVEYVVISQTSTDPCTTQAECTLTIRYMQVFHVDGKKWMDIAYNFMVAGDGKAYEGRGWDVVGAHTAPGMNGISVGISFVGTFSDVLPPPVQLRACKQLIEEGIKLGKISEDYKLIADRQVSNTENPGQKFYEELQKWDHWTANDSGFLN